MNKVMMLVLLSLNFPLFCQDNIYQFAQKEYYILDYPINIRAQPNLQGEIIGKLKLNDKITILQRTDNLQYIDGVYSYWYMIKYNEITGYIFGGYIAVNRLVCDIDNNGTDDYIFFRFSRSDGFNFIIDSYQDIFIYINNIRISTKNIFRDSREDHFWMWC
jgi:hypothetical protein